MPIRSFISLFLSFFLLNACYLQRDGDALEAQVRALEARQNAFISTVESERGELNVMLEDAEAEIQLLQAALQEAQTQLSHNSAGLGVEVDELINEISELRGMLEFANHRVQELSQEIEIMRTDFEIQLQSLTTP